MSGHSASRPSAVHVGSEDFERKSRSELTTEVLALARDAGPDEARELRDRIVLLHLDVAESVAWRYRSRGQDHQDLVQVARLGLIEAAGRFDPDRGPFLAYAVPTMVGHVKRHFRDHGWVVRPPRQIQEKQAEIARAKDDLTHLLRRRPTSADLAKHLGMTERQVQEAEDIDGCFHPASLDAALAHSANDLNAMLGEKEPQLESVEALATVSPACGQLPDDDRRLLYLRFFKMCSQEEIAAEFGISQMQVSRWLRRTLGQLKEAIGETEPSRTSEVPSRAGSSTTPGNQSGPSFRTTSQMTTVPVRAKTTLTVCSTTAIRSEPGDDKARLAS